MLRVFGSDPDVFEWLKVSQWLDISFKTIPHFGAEGNRQLLVDTSTSNWSSFCLQCFDTVGWAAGRGSGL